MVFCIPVGHGDYCVGVLLPLEVNVTEGREDQDQEAMQEACEAGECAQICVWYSLPLSQSWHVSQPSSDCHELFM